MKQLIFGHSLYQKTYLCQVSVHQYFNLLYKMYNIICRDFLSNKKQFHTPKKYNQTSKLNLGCKAECIL